jgi:hypothetical protein
MPSKRPVPIFEILFDGPGLYPEKIPVATLAATLSAVQRLADGEPVLEEEEEDEKRDAVEDDRSLRLLEIKRGSAVFRLSAPSGQDTVNRIRRVGGFLAKPDEVGENDYILSPLERLSATARALECRIILREPGRAGGVLAIIEPETYHQITKSLLIQGETSFVGTFQRVGGATGMKCSIRVDFQHRLMYCKVASQEVSREMGRLLYDEVVVHGSALWLRTSWRIFAFTVTGISQPKQGSLFQAFEDLRKAGGDKWGQIADPEAYLQEVTGQR